MTPLSTTKQNIKAAMSDYQTVIELADTIDTIVKNRGWSFRTQVLEIKDRAIQEQTQCLRALKKLENEIQLGKGNHDVPNLGA